MCVNEYPDSVWELSLKEGKNPSHTGGFLTGYDAREFTDEQVVAREGGQNAADAGRDVPGITELVFQKLRMDITNKQKFLNLFRFNEILKKRKPIFDKDNTNIAFATNLKKFLDDKTDLTALLIRDYNTCGLGGTWDAYKKNDHFSRLVCALNLNDKADDNANSGGSYGLGKTAYAKNSSINTVIYHTVLS